MFARIVSSRWLCLISGIFLAGRTPPLRAGRCKGGRKKLAHHSKVSTERIS